MVAAKGAHRIHTAIGSIHDEFRLHDFAEMRMLAAIDARFTHVGMAVEDGFDFFGENFPASKIDHRRLAREQKEKTIRVEPSDVAGEKPAVAHHLPERNPRRDVGVENSRPFHRHFAAAIRVRLVDAHLKTSGGLAHGIPARTRIVRVQTDEAEFNHAQPLYEREAEALEEIIRDILRQAAGRRNREPHGRNGYAGIIARQHREMKRRGVENRALPAVDRIEERFGHHMPRKHDRRALAQIQHDGNEEMMRHRQAPDHGVAVVNAEGFVCRADTVADGFVRKRDTLPRAGRAGGESDEGQVQSVIIRWRRRGELRKKTSRREQHALIARFVTEDRLQLHRVGDFNNFVLGAFRRNGHDHGIHPPERIRQRDIADAIGKAQADAATCRQAQRLDRGGKLIDALLERGVGNDFLALDQCGFIRPACGGLFQRFDQIHSAAKLPRRVDNARPPCQSEVRRNTGRTHPNFKARIFCP